MEEPHQGSKPVEYATAFSYYDSKNLNQRIKIKISFDFTEEPVNNHEPKTPRISESWSE